MTNHRFQSVISRLDVTRKWLLGSAVVVGISTLLPWYEDLDSFGTGALYLGVTGPLFLVGLMVLASAVITGYWLMAPALGRRLPSFPIKEGALFVILGVQDLLLLLVANSVFFHPKFGVNILLKNTKFGMILGVVGVVMMIWSGYRIYRQNEQRSWDIGPEGRLEPLIKMPEARAPRELHSEHAERTHEPAHESVRESGAPESDRPVRRDVNFDLSRDPSHYRGGRQTPHGPVEHAIERLGREMRDTERKTPVERDPSQKAEPQALRLDL